MPKRTFVYTSGGAPIEPYEVGEEWRNAAPRAAIGTEGITYAGGVATDGTPIDTRKRHREYLQRNGLAMASDYSPEYHERKAASKERAENKERRQTIERAFHKSRGY